MYLNNFKPHKIRGIDKNICCCEQKIAYNFLFSYVDGSSRSKETNLSLMQNHLHREQSGSLKKYDTDLIYHYILQSYERYLASKTRIFSSYEGLAAVIYSDVYKAA